MQIKGIPQWRHGSCELEVWEAVDVPVSRRSSRQMRTIRMPRGHLIDKCDLVRVSHMMLLSRTARRNLRKRGAEQTQYPWHFARPTSWQLTGDANYQDLLLADIELPNSSKIESWYNSPLQSIMLILRLDSIPFRLRIVPRRYPGVNHDQGCHEHPIPSETSPCRDSSSHDKMASVHESGPSSQSRSQATKV